MQRIPLIELVDVHHERPYGTTILGATLQIWPGEIVAIRGPSGAGKTTLLRLLAGALTPSRGTRRCCATSAEEGLEQRAERAGGFERMAFLSQRPSFMLTLSVLEHVMLGLLARGLRDRTSIRERATRGLFEAGIVHMASAKVGVLATRERRLVLVAEVLALRPSLVFVDEGYGAGLTKLASPGRAIVLVAGDDLCTSVDRSFHIDPDGSVRALEGSAIEAA